MREIVPFLVGLIRGIAIAATPLVLLIVVGAAAKTEDKSVLFVVFVPLTVAYFSHQIWKYLSPKGGWSWLPSTLVILFFVYIWTPAALVVVSVPGAPTAEELVENQPHVDVIRGLLREAGNPSIPATGPWTGELQNQFSVFLENGLQKQEHWGNPESFHRDAENGTRWPHVADGIWSSSYSKHLAKAIAAQPGAFANAASELRQAADALAADDILWSPSISEGLALTFLNGSLSGFADELAVWMRYGDDPEGARRAHRDYKLLTRFVSDYSPIWVLAANVLGALFSVLAVFVAMLLIRYAPSAGDAFKVAFWIEILEGVGFIIGQGLTAHEMPQPFYWLTSFVASAIHEFSPEFLARLEERVGLGVGGQLSVAKASPWGEIGVILVIAVVVGLFEMGAWKKLSPKNR